MKLILQRVHFKDATLGFLYPYGLDNPVFSTIERPWAQNKQEISCIPEGLYKVVPYSSEKFKDVWEVTDVYNRTAILIHPANMANQLKGCIAPGLASGYMYDGNINQNVKAVTNSQQAIRQLKDLTNYPSEFDLSIENMVMPF